MIASTLLQAGGGAHGAGHGTAGLGWSPLVVLGLLVVVGLVAYLAVRSRPGQPPAERFRQPSPERDERVPSDESVAVLRRQYARGAIDDEEFERRRSRLEQSHRYHDSSSSRS